MELLADYYTSWHSGSWIADYREVTGSAVNISREWVATRTTRSTRKAYLTPKVVIPSQTLSIKSRLLKGNLIMCSFPRYSRTKENRAFGAVSCSSFPQEAAATGSFWRTSWTRLAFSSLLKNSTTGIWTLDHGTWPPRRREAKWQNAQALSLHFMT